MNIDFLGLFAPVSNYSESSLNYCDNKKRMSPPQTKAREVPKVFNDTLNKIPTTIEQKEKQVESNPMDLNDPQKKGQVGLLLDLLNHLYRLKGLTLEELNKRFAALEHVTGTNSKTKLLNDFDAAQIPLLIASIAKIKNEREEQKKIEEKNAMTTSHSNSLKLLFDYKVLSVVEIGEVCLQIGTLQMTELLHKWGDPQAFMEKFIKEHLDPYFKGIITRENDDASRPPLIMELEEKFREKFPTSSISSEHLQELALDTYIRISVLHYQQTSTAIKLSNFRNLMTMTSGNQEKQKECSSNCEKEIQELKDNFYDELSRALNIDFKMEINTRNKNKIKKKVEVFTYALKTA